MKKIFKFIPLVLILVTFSACKKDTKVDYGNLKNWAFAESVSSEKKADVFFLAPAIFNSPGKHNMPLDYSMNKTMFISAMNMEKGVFDNSARFFAPFYREVELYEYLGLTQSSEQNHKKYLDIAYNDVKDAFIYYMKHYNEYRPLILAGFSQGSDMCLRLLKDFSEDEDFKKVFVACYSIGWSFTEEESSKYPQIKFAEKEDDTGVVVSYMSEAVNFNDKTAVRANGKIRSINPLNWKTDSTPADKSLNLGSCTIGFDGAVTKEQKKLTGCYIDEKRGTLKITDVKTEDYPPILSVFKDGDFHLYDYTFFYRNLQKNVEVRLNAFLSKEQEKK